MSRCLRCSFDKVTGTCRKCGRERAQPKNVPASSLGLEDLIAPEPSLDAIVVGGEVLLPEHSPLGGSGAKRWLNCPGSTALIQRLKIESEETEYAAAGTQAHALAERCLNGSDDAWEHVHEYNLLKPEDAILLQSYIDYVRSRPGRPGIEETHHRPELHPLMYGKLDAAIVPVLESPIALEVVDLKWGEGVYVEVEGNEQGLYYLALKIYEDPTFFADEERVRFTIAQPRLEWAGEPIRSWEITVGEVKQWAQDVLLPGMHRQDATFDPGEWCQFCPAKLHCPAMQGLMADLADVDQMLPAEVLSDEDLGALYVMGERVKTYLKAIGEETRKRLMDHKAIPGAKLVAGKVDRVFKGDAEEAARTRYGSDAYTTPKLLSPAQMEKLPGGKTFVAEHAYRPEAGYTVALEGDKRAGVQPKSGAEIFSNVAQHLIDSAA